MNAANILFPFTNLFPGSKPDPTSYSSMNGGSGPAQGQFATEGIGGKQDSLTQALRSLSNFTGQAGMDTLARGQSTIDSGKDLFQTGANDLEQPLSLYRALLSGDRAAIESAISPEKDAIGRQFDNIRQMFSTTGARGGGTASTLAKLPFEQTRQITDLINKARMGGASGLSNLALNEANLGLGESGLGIQQQGVADALLGLTNQNLLGRRGQNVNVDISNTGNLTSGLSHVLSALV